MIFSQFTQYPNLQYGFSNRTDGSMRRNFEPENRSRYFRSLGIDPVWVVTADLVHGANVITVTDKAAGTMVAETDSLITQSKNLFISATAADCFLLYFYDPLKNVIGLAHAGWRGLLAGIVENTVDGLIKSFAVDPCDLLVSIGPSIRECHFEISPGDKEKFIAYPEYIFKKADKVYVNLPSIIQAKLQSQKLSAGHIEDCNICTHCNEKEYFSYRRDKPKDIQVQVGYIGLV